VVDELVLLRILHLLSQFLSQFLYLFFGLFKKLQQELCFGGICVIPVVLSLIVQAGIGEG
jgi:hypothetical protein